MLTLANMTLLETERWCTRLSSYYSVTRSCHKDRPRVESSISTMMSAFTKVNMANCALAANRQRIEFKTWLESLCAVRLPPTPQIEYHPSVVVGASAQRLGRARRWQRCPALPNAHTPLLPTILPSLSALHSARKGVTLCLDNLHSFRAACSCRPVCLSAVAYHSQQLPVTGRDCFQALASPGRYISLGTVSACFQTRR